MSPAGNGAESLYLPMFCKYNLNVTLACLRIPLQPVLRSSTVHSHEETVLIVALSGRSKTLSSCCTPSPTQNKHKGCTCKMQEDWQSLTSITHIPRYSTFTGSLRKLQEAPRAVPKKFVTPSWRQATTMSSWWTGVRSQHFPGTRWPCRMDHGWADTWRDLFGSC